MRQSENRYKNCMRQIEKWVQSSQPPPNQGTLRMPPPCPGSGPYTPERFGLGMRRGEDKSHGSRQQSQSRTAPTTRTFCCSKNRRGPASPRHLSCTCEHRKPAGWVCRQEVAALAPQSTRWCSTRLVLPWSRRPLHLGCTQSAVCQLRAFG